MPPTVDDVMRSAVRTGPTDVSVAAIAGEFSKHGIGSLVLLDDAGELVGIVTETDIVDAVAGGMDLSKTAAGDVASDPVVTVERTAPVAEAAELMDKHAIRRLPVVDTDGGIVGIVTSRDLTALLPQLGRTQRDDREPVTD